MYQIRTATVSSRTRWAGHVTRMGKMINAYKILVGKPEAEINRRREIILKWAGSNLLMITSGGRLW